MYHIKNDQRSIRSSDMLYDGLARLMHEKPFHSITVTDLVEAAQVGRATFYRNFDEIEDVLWMRCDKVVDGLIDYLQEYRQKHQDALPTTILEPVLYYFYAHSELVELLMKAKRIHIFEESIQSHFEPFKPMFGTFFGVEEEYVGYIMAMRIGSIIKVLVHWIETGKKQPPDELAARLSGIVGNMVALEQLL